MSEKQRDKEKQRAMSEKNTLPRFLNESKKTWLITTPKKQRYKVCVLTEVCLKHQKAPHTKQQPHTQTAIRQQPNQ